MSKPSPSESLHERANEARQAEQEQVDRERDGEDELRTLWLDDEDTGELISSLSSETAREILVTLHEEPATASEVADEVGTSVQNVRHHLDSLGEAGLVDVVDMRYSSKGREMDVYAPVDEPLVVFVGSEDRGAGLVDSLKRFLGAIGVLAAASLLVQYLVELRYSAGGPGIPRMGESAGTGGVAPLGVPPAALFFAGGMLVLALASAWRVYRESREDATPA